MRLLEHGSSSQATPDCQATASDPTRWALFPGIDRGSVDYGYGRDVQRERCKAHALAKGWTVADVYADEGLSGTLDATKRPTLAAMLADVEAGHIDAIIVLTLDRLECKTTIVLDIANRCREINIALVSCKESLDTSTPQGNLSSLCSRLCLNSNGIPSWNALPQAATNAASGMGRRVAGCLWAISVPLTVSSRLTSIVQHCLADICPS